MQIKEHTPRATDAVQACVAAWSVVVFIIFVIMLLLIHHKLAHSDPRDREHFLQDPCDQWFQCGIYPRGDVCNFTTCSHEMWIIALALVAGATICGTFVAACAPFG